MKVVALSDTHMRHLEIAVPEADVFVHGGDALSRGSMSELISFANWMEKLPHQHKIYVPGNHDICLKTGPGLDLLAEKGVKVLFDESLTIEGKVFHGTPWSLTFGNWAFMGDEYRLAKAYELIPANVDFLISHGPPLNCLDGVVDRSGVLAVGSRSLRQAIEEKNPKIVVCGHIHSGRIQGPNKDGYEKINQSDIIAISTLNEAYQYVYEPKIFEL